MALKETGFDFVFEAQQVFRLVLDSMARPGKVNSLSVPRLAPPGTLPGYAASVAFTLLDGEVTFAALGEEGPSWASYLALNTGAVPTGVEEADFIFAPGGRLNSELAGARRGTLLYPDRSATVVLVVESLAGAGPNGVTLSGPGVRGTTLLFIDGIDRANLEILAGANSQYPLGLDTIVVGRDGSLACLPRSTMIRIEVVD